VERILEQMAVTQATEQQARQELQETVQQNATAINALRQEVSDSVADLIGIIDYAMEQMEELIRKSLNPSINVNQESNP
jgi:tRNA U34 5-carboxymethylaminomethyl modifying GTPase MnmE/TrmE